MKQYLVDTSIIIAHLRGTAGAQITNETRLNCVLSYVTVGELLQGARNKREQKTTTDVCSLFDIDWGSLSINRTSHRLLSEYAMSHGMGVMDAIIAATALERDLTIVTLNVKHFSCVTGIRVQSKV